MVERRKMIAGGLVAGLVGAVLPAPAEAAPAAAGTGAEDENTGLLRGILDELRTQRPTCGTVYCPGLERIRSQQRVFLRAQGRYPEYIDVGLDVWDQIYEWHVKYQLPIKIGRLPDGFYGMPFYLTTLILRPNMDLNYVGPPYDGR